MMEENYFGRLLIDLSDFIKQQVPEIKWIDQDFGQLETFEVRPAVAFPCVLIDFAATSYSELAGLAQMGDVTVVIRLGFAPFAQSNQAAPMDVRESALEYYAIEQKLYKALQGYQTEYTQSFNRIGADTERRDDALRVRALTFGTCYEDYTALPMNEKVAAVMNVETEQP